MEGIWLVLSKAAVITWLIVLVSGSILAIVIGIVEYHDLKKGEADSEKESLEALVGEMTKHGIVTKCSASNRCAAVSGILETERECEQLRKEYDELRERYKNLREAYEGQKDAFENLEADYKELEEKVGGSGKQP